MNVLDENIIASQCEQLRSWRIPFRQIGADAGRKGMDDTDDIIPLLRRLPRPSFFTRDDDFYERRLCHPGYCRVTLSVPKQGAAAFVRRVLRHPGFDSRAKRLGCVLLVSHGGITCWRRGSEQERHIAW